MCTTNNTAPSADFATRLTGWETVWGAYVADGSDANWHAMDAWCAANGETNPIPAPAAYRYHDKPAGGGACTVCGVAHKGLRARHRKVAPSDRTFRSARFVKIVKVCFGTDYTEEAIG